MRINDPGSASGVTDSGDRSRLAFMLARQAMTRWRCDVERLGTELERRRPATWATHDLELAVRQVASLTDHMRPFAQATDEAVRFEAQEVLVALETLENRIWRLRGRLDPTARRRTPMEVFANLTRVRH